MCEAIAAEPALVDDHTWVMKLAAARALADLVGDLLAAHYVVPSRSSPGSFRLSQQPSLTLRAAMVSLAADQPARLGLVVRAVTSGWPR